MKKLLLLFSALFLTSCIDVDDFGPYWDQAIVAPALIGTWKKTGTNEMIIIREKDGSYEIAPQSEPDEKPIYPARTLKIGAYTFFAIGAGDGDMQRYKIKKNAGTTYMLNTKALLAFMKQNNLESDNISVDEGFKDPTLEIDTLDEKVFEIISKIPDTKRYWTVIDRYKKVD